MRLFHYITVLFPVFFSVSAVHPVEMDFERRGVSFGGTHLVGFDLEYYSGNYSLLFSFGSFDFSDICASAGCRAYIGDSENRPYAGIALWEVVAFPSSGGVGFLTLVNIPLGYETEISAGGYVGFELGFSFPVSVVSVGTSEKPSISSNSTVIMPGIYYRWDY